MPGGGEKKREANNSIRFTDVKPKALLNFDLSKLMGRKEITDISQLNSIGQSIDILRNEKLEWQ